jgi:hypothetical protein
VRLYQRGYIDKVLRRFGMEGWRPVATPQAVGYLPDPVSKDEYGVNDPTIPWLVVFVTWCKVYAQR